MWLHLVLKNGQQIILDLKPVWFNEGARHLSDVAGILILSSENPLDF